MLKEWGAGLERDIELEREGKTRVIMKERDRSREQDGEDLKTGGVGGPARKDKAWNEALFCLVRPGEEAKCRRGTSGRARGTEEGFPRPKDVLHCVHTLPTYIQSGHIMPTWALDACLGRYSLCYSSRPTPSPKPLAHSSTAKRLTRTRTVRRK